MSVGTEDWREAPGRTLLGVAKLSLDAVIDAFGALLYSVMRLLNGFVMAALSLAVAALLLVCAGFALINLAHPTHFPFGVVLYLVAACGLAAIVWQAVLYWLPRSRMPAYTILGLLLVCVLVWQVVGLSHRTHS